MKKILLATVIGLSTFAAQAEQEIKFVMEATYPPFEFTDEAGNIVGFDVDLANALCAEMEATCTFHNQAFDSLIPALRFNRYDAAISAMDITEARLEQVAFSNPYYDNAAAFVAVAPQESLDGLRVGVQNGSTHQSYLVEKMPNAVEAVPYGSYQDAFVDLNLGRIDAIFGDTAVVAEWFEENDKVQYVGETVTDAQYFGQGFGIAVNKDNQELVDELNTALATIKENGTYQQIFDQYFGN
uniref:lysine/arginine/ornithine ABC transporter substrate-binding protein n=1 Tax=Thaumasiovibrio occultus TaxID=1891184 RepID=UPI000B35E2D1|nr:lysine/arginine/ornithine ABC transporter substrate-binding protein [Thaumasiovibrio occultus]